MSSSNIIVIDSFKKSIYSDYKHDLLKTIIHLDRLEKIEKVEDNFYFTNQLNNILWA